MNKEKFLNLGYNPDDNTKEEIEKLHKEGESLSKVQLKFADMKNTKLVNADLSYADLTRADFSGASLYGANLEGATLFKTNLEGANLKSANMKNCNLLGADFTNAKLNNVDWGEGNIVLNEVEAETAINNGDIETAIEKYKESEDIYRALKMSLQSQSLGEDAGKLFLREMIVKRKQLPKYSPLRFAHKFAHIAFGYGEKIGNILYSILTVIVISAFVYGIEGVSYGDYTLGFWGDVGQFGGILGVLGNLLYFSVVVFSTVGFGEILPIGPLGKSMMMIEGIAGGLILSIFMIAVYRQLMDR
ncbi:uncharacterized protein METZ01_LOCUS273839 [marine metagenome]|uniref:Potassium channel domain-containing protein n=1 Tax=marine metagenome TaxID=408172 RepID=A0A382KBH9_9ZZZZ